MTDGAQTIELCDLSIDEYRAAIPDLAQLIIDAVAGGAGVALWKDLR